MLLETGHHVTFYCPERDDLMIAENMIDEMEILAKEQMDLEMSTTKVNRFSMKTGPDFNDCNILGSI